MDEKKAVEALKRQYNRQNNFIKENYDRQTVVFRKGIKERIMQTGESVNGFVNRLVIAELERIEKKQNDITSHKDM